MTKESTLIEGTLFLFKVLYILEFRLFEQQC